MSVWIDHHGRMIGGEKVESKYRKEVPEVEK